MLTISVLRIHVSSAERTFHSMEHGERIPSSAISHNLTNIFHQRLAPSCALSPRYVELPPDLLTLLTVFSGSSLLHVRMVSFIST